MTSHALFEPAWAKVNLYLHVVGRRRDGYHLLDSLAVFPAIGDRLWAAPDHEFSLELTGKFASGLSAGPDNLVLRAAQALAGTSPGAGTRARLTLEKNLPIASGIGGGSADAAACLRLLARLWSLPDMSAHAEIAASLGADIPVCLASRPARMQGIGEILKAAPSMPDCGMVLINPGVAVSTPEVFRARGGGFSDPASLPDGWADTASMAMDLAAATNDLQNPAITLCPPIADVLAALRSDSHCLLARMSGSGATCFGLFADARRAEQAALRLRHPGWFVWGGGLVAPTGLPDRAGSP